MDCSPLGRLPVELRLMIYEYTLAKGKPISVCRDLCAPTSGPRNFSSTGTLLIRSIEQCCRKTRIECTGVFYDRNSFHFYCPKSQLNMPAATINEFLNMVGPRDRLLVRQISIEVGSTHDIWSLAFFEVLRQLQHLAIANSHILIRCEGRVWAQNSYSTYDLLRFSFAMRNPSNEMRDFAAKENERRRFSTKWPNETRKGCAELCQLLQDSRAGEAAAMKGVVKST